MSDEITARRVLVAEDEALIRMDLVESLQELGYEVVAQAGDGEEAVALAAQHKPDICIMDVKMPKLDGISAAEKIRDLRIPVVLVTAFSQKELVQRASEAGAMGYLVKPWNKSDLTPAIDIALSRYEQIAALEHEVADLNERFETRKLIDRAKGILHERLGMAEPEAFREIQKISMNRRVTMKEVSQTIIDQMGEAKPEA
jgi:AmiR/NasT family two-component response regulator